MTVLSTNLRAKQGAIWLSLSFALSNILRFGNNLVLTRLLAPDLFGLMALVSTIVIGLRLFSDTGINASIIQNRRGDEPSFYNTAWTVQVCRGFILWLCCLCLAIPLANFYDEQRLVWLIPVIGFTTIIDGFTSTALYQIQRHLKLTAQAIFEISVQVATIVIMISWAFMSQSIWPLVGAQILGSTFKAIGSYWLIPGQRNCLKWDKSAFKDLFSFGRWIFLSTAITFMANQTDRLILGKFVSFEMLGIYSIAFTLSDIPKMMILKLGNSIIFPIVSMRRDMVRGDLHQRLLEKRKLILLVLAFTLPIFISFGDTLVLFLYDENYAQASWMLTIFATALWPTLLYATGLPCLLGLGKPIYATIGNFSRFIVLIIGIPIAFTLAGPVGAVIVAACSDFPVYATVTYGLWKEKISFVKQDLIMTALLLIILGLNLMIRVHLGLGLPLTANI